MATADGPQDNPNPTPERSTDFTPTHTDPVRLDRWLWSVRLFPSRSAATEACSSGKVSIDGEPVKPARKVALGDTIVLRRRGFDTTIVARDLIPRRVGAPIAVTCYDDLTPPRVGTGDPMADELLAADPATSGRREQGSGRPTKRDRRAIDRLRGRPR